MAAVTGAIWKCATDSFENVERFEELELMKTLVGILKVILQYCALDSIMIGAKIQNKTWQHHCDGFTHLLLGQYGCFG